MTHLPPIPLLTGPTASGKTALSLELARSSPLEIVSADSMMVYRGMDIGTAKPSVLERAGVPHHLIDVREPWQDYDVTQFVQDAEQVIADIVGRGRVPLVVGGTGFYLAGLVQGLTTTPKADPQVQARLERELEAHGLDALLERVQAVRPQELERLQRNPRRVVRALELFERTGRFPSEFPRTAPRFGYGMVALCPPPEQLEQRIRARVDQMLGEGFAGEVRALYDNLPSPLEVRPTALQAIGYREVFEALEAELTHLPEEVLRQRSIPVHKNSVPHLRDTLILRTRQYAKRQLTWIRTQLGLECLPLEVARPRLEALVRAWSTP